MSDEIIKNKVFNRRLVILLFLKISLISALIIRLFYLQIIKFRSHKTLSDSNRIKNYLILPLRGNIVDRQRVELANNSSYYRILFNPEVATNVNKTLTKLAKILNIDKKALYYYSRKFQQISSSGALLLYNDLSWEEVAKVEANIPDLPGIMIDIAQRRNYAFNHANAHIVGYVSAVSKTESKKSQNTDSFYISILSC